MKKKLIWLGGGAVIALLLAFLGPDLLGLYRLDRYVASSAEAYQAEQGQWPHLTDVCIGCHGVKGNSLHQGYPSLAGQPAAYVAAQLLAFASGQRSSPTMGPLAMTLSAPEIHLLSDHFARQPVDENRHSLPDPQLQERGRQLVAAGRCAACHGEGLMGRDRFPRLAAQGDDYLLAQLDAFASGARIDATGTMQGIAASATPEDRKAIASYLASLAPARR